MNRRSFLSRVAPAVAAPFVVNGLTMRAFGRSPMFGGLANILGETDRVLVLIQLNGGNDGINTVIPLSYYSDYARLRANIAIPEAKALKLNAATGLHPSMIGMKKLFDDGKLAVINGVGYPNSNLSHFRSTDIWMTGSESNQYLASGWAGRYLNGEYPDYPNLDPKVMPDPVAIQMGAVVSLALQGESQSMGIAIQDPTTFYNLVNGTKDGSIDNPPDTNYGTMLKYIRQVQIDSLQYAGQIKTAADKAVNKVTYPTAQQNQLAAQLQIVARLIAGGLKTRIYMVSLGGFDTHATQVSATDTTTGSHATLLDRVSSAISVFQEDLRQLGVEGRVAGLTFSEFGRRVESNASSGTDHGTAAPMFAFGAGVIPGVYGTYPSLTDTDKGNLKMVYDFRQIYASALGQWFGLEGAALKSAMLKDFTQIPIFKPLATGVEEFAGESLAVSAYPNPSSEYAMVDYSMPEAGRAALYLCDAVGRRLGTISDEKQEQGHHSLRVDVRRLPVGTYMLMLQTNSRTATGRIVVAR